MVKEISWQSNIIKRIKKEGGWGAKWATQYNVGVPDLILNPVDFGTIFVECKLEKQWLKNTVRTIKYKPKQRDVAHDINRTGGIAFGIVIVHNGPSTVYICPTAMPAPREEFRIDLHGLLQVSYLWRTGAGRIGDAGIFPNCTLSRFLRKSFEDIIDTERRV